MIQKKLIEYLLAIERAGSFTKAAQELHVSQPALSRMIIGLERELGAALFDREQTPLRLTYIGEKYIAACLKVLSINESIEREIADIADGTRGRIRLGISLHLSISISHIVFPKFHRLYPDIEIELIEKSTIHLEEMVRMGQLDMAVVYNRSYGDLYYKYVADNSVYLAIPPSYQKAHGYHMGVNAPVGMDALKDQPFILLKRGHGLRTIADMIFQKFHIDPAVIFETGSIEVAHRLTKADMGFTFVSPVSFSDKRSMLEGAYSPVKDFAAFNKIHICLRDTFCSKAMKELIQIISDALDQSFLVH